MGAEERLENWLFKILHNSFQGKNREVTVKINIKNKFSWFNKNAVQIKFQIFVI